jgi:hypothetical protein
VKHGVILPRDEKYAERAKSGKLGDEPATPAKKGGKKAAR